MLKALVSLAAFLFISAPALADDPISLAGTAISNSEFFKVKAQDGSVYEYRTPSGSFVGFWKGAGSFGFEMGRVTPCSAYLGTLAGEFSLRLNPHEGATEPVSVRILPGDEVEVYGSCDADGSQHYELKIQSQDISKATVE